MDWFWIILLLILLCALALVAVIAVHFFLAKKRADITQNYRDLEAQLRYRHSLADRASQLGSVEPLLIARGHAQSFTLKEIDQWAEAEDAYNFAWQGLRMDANLLQNPDFQKIIRELDDTNNQIASAKEAYNASVYDYNNTIDVIPMSFLAKFFGFLPGRYFGGYNPAPPVAPAGVVETRDLDGEKANVPDDLHVTQPKKPTDVTMGEKVRNMIGLQTSPTEPVPLPAEPQPTNSSTSASETPVANPAPVAEATPVSPVTTEKPAEPTPEPTPPPAPTQTPPAV